MNRRERVRSALELKEPDRVPIDFGGHRSSGIMAGAYAKLRDHLGLPPKPLHIYDTIQQLAIVDDDVLEHFDVDTVELGRGFSLSEKDWQPWVLPDGIECLVPSWVNLAKKDGSWYLKSSSGRDVGIKKPGMLYFDQIHWPLLDGIPADLSDLPKAIGDNMWSVATPPDPDTDTTALKAGAKRLRNSTDRAVIGLFGGSLFELSQQICRNDNFFLLMASEPDTTHRLLDALTEFHLSNLSRYLEAVGSYIDVILFGDDLGMQSGPQMSPAMYREYFKPRHARMWRKAKELSDVKVMLHCCGGIRPLMDDLIDAGLDTTNPVQISCEGMEASALKKDFGDRVCFWGGGCDTQSILPYGTPGEIREHVMRQAEILSPGGGFVFQQVHNIMVDVPPQNIAAMFDAINEFNRR
jgi:uroporphyrinogen decarboxylase